MAKKVFELKQDRARVAAEAGKIVQIAVNEDRDNTPDEWTLIKGNEERIAALDRQIAVMERVEAFDGGNNRQTDPNQNPGERGNGPDLDGKVKYSVLRALSGLFEQRMGNGKPLDGLEAEVSQDIAKRVGKSPTGVYIPLNLATHRDVYNGTERRDLTTTTGIGAIPNILGTDLIQLLRNKMVLNRLGATVLNDMTGGTFSLPKQTAAGTAYYVAEGVAATTSNPTIGQVTWTPKTLGARYPITRKFMLQTSQDAEALVRDDLTRVIALELDRAGINGSGTNTQPLGILQDPNVTTVAIGTNGGDPTWANVVNLETQVAVANADFGRMGYLTSNQGRGKLKTTAKIGSTYPVFMWETGQGDMGMVNGYSALSSQQVPTGLTKGSNAACTALIFGNFQSATYAFWSGLDIVIDPFTQAGAGSIIFNALQDYDYQQRWATAYAKIVDMNQT